MTQADIDGARTWTANGCDPGSASLRSMLNGISCRDEDEVPLKKKDDNMGIINVVPSLASSSSAPWSPAS